MGQSATSSVVEPWPHFHLNSAIFTIVTEKANAAAAGSRALNADGNGKPIKEGGRGGRKKSHLAAAASIGTTTTANPLGIDLDLPVDPNEPTYCICNQVSYGEMVACDNREVSVTIEVTIFGGSGGFCEESE